MLLVFACLLPFYTPEEGSEPSYKSAAVMVRRFMERTPKPRPVIPPASAMRTDRSQPTGLRLIAKALGHYVTSQMSVGFNSTGSLVADGAGGCCWVVFVFFEILVGIWRGIRNTGCSIGATFAAFGRSMELRACEYVRPGDCDYLRSEATSADM